jgi:outer membrane protein, heavy metal efflux system
MHRRKPPHSRAALARHVGAASVGAALFFSAAAGLAQPNLPAAAPAALETPAGLAAGFQAAWSLQPEHHALQARREAASAQAAAARGWTPEPPALELSVKSDRFHRHAGAREVEAGVSVPLWLPGERGRAGELAEAESRTINSRLGVARLTLAAQVRDAWWTWEKARIDADIARLQLDSARRLADDIARRTKAGDLARADQHQAEGAVATAESFLAQSRAALAGAALQFKALTGLPPAAGAPGETEPDADARLSEAHPVLQDLKDRAAVADRRAALASTQSRANPEVMLATTRDRGASVEPSVQTVTLGVRIPFGAGPRHEHRVATARAEATELQAQLSIERARLLAEHDAAKARVEAGKAQLVAAERRERLARETRGFFEKSFRLGETDLPTRLRIEAEATEAERQAARTRVELAASISAWRQALGLLPQ